MRVLAPAGEAALFLLAMTSNVLGVEHEGGVGHVVFLFVPWVRPVVCSGLMKQLRVIVSIVKGHVYYHAHV